MILPPWYVREAVFLSDILPTLEDGTKTELERGIYGLNKFRVRPVDKYFNGLQMSPVPVKITFQLYEGAEERELLYDWARSRRRRRNDRTKSTFLRFHPVSTFMQTVDWPARAV